jgi:hypothetical protein
LGCSPGCLPRQQIFRKTSKLSYYFIVCGLFEWTRICAGFYRLLSLNRDSKQFQQYQQNEQSPFIFTHWIQDKQRPRHMTLKYRPWLGTGTKKWQGW